MSLVGSYVDREGLVVSVAIEETRQGSYLVTKDRWRSPLHRDGASIELELGSAGNARLWAECDVLTRGGHLRQSAEAVFCGSVIREVGVEALHDSRRKVRTLPRFVHVRAPDFGE